MSKESVITWNSVLKIHKVVNGIYTKNKIVKSILCNFEDKGSYPNKKYGNKIKYFVGTKTPSGGIISLINMCGNKIPIRVFEKISVNKWKDIGNYVVVSINDQSEDDFISIYLEKTNIS